MNSDFVQAASPLLVLTAFSATWAYCRVAAGRELVTYEPRRPVPWSGAWLLLTVLIYLIATMQVHTFTETIFESRLPVDARAEFQSLDTRGRMAYPGYIITVLKADCAGKLIAVAIITALLAFVARADARDLGLSFSRFGRNARLGFLGFFVIVPPALLLQAAIVHGLDIEYDHDIIKALGGEPTGEVLYWSLFAAIVVAPLVEEYMFRGLLQGWLERLIGAIQTASGNSPAARGGTDNSVVCAPQALESVDNTPHDATTIVLHDLSQVELPPEPIVRPKPSMVPNVVTSALFGLMHFGQGPAPITLFFLSLGLGYLYRQTHSIWPGVIVHFMLNSFSMVIVLFGPKP